MRSFSAWYTTGNCDCRYKYGNLHSHRKGFVANDMEEWMLKIAKQIKFVFNLDSAPDSCKLNRYDEDHALGYHADNEELFKSEDGNIGILSMSFDSSRKLNLLPDFESEDKVVSVVLFSEDILAMRKRTQQTHQHEVAASKGTQSSPRYNLTFRYVKNHHRRCKRNNS